MKRPEKKEYNLKSHEDSSSYIKDLTKYVDFLEQKNLKNETNFLETILNLQNEITKALLKNKAHI
jgi:cell division protein ZapA (FtsZ GTPase activity inhibitor)